MPDIAFEITQTVKPSYRTLYVDSKQKYGEMTASEQFAWYKGVHEQLFWRDCGLETYCVCEFHKNMNLHFHGVVIVPDDMTKLEIVDVRKKMLKLGLSNFRPIYNLDSWLTYIAKDQDDFPDGYIIESYDFADRLKGASEIALKC
jgi:hypothetical protein